MRESSLDAAVSSSWRVRMGRCASTGAAPSAFTKRNVSIDCRFPSSKTSKSVCLRSATGLPCLSVTMASTRTKLMPVRKTGCCGCCSAGGVCAGGCCAAGFWVAGCCDAGCCDAGCCEVWLADIDTASSPLATTIAPPRWAFRIAAPPPADQRRQRKIDASGGTERDMRPMITFSFSAEQPRPTRAHPPDRHGFSAMTHPVEDRATALGTASAALTRLAEDETLFRDSVLEFADREIRPLVRDMDEHAKIPRALIDKLFALGIMGIEIPESFGGSGASFFHSVLAVEALARVDPSISVLVDVQNTLVINAIRRWGNDEVQRRYLPKLASSTVGAYCLSEAGSGSDAFALQTRAAETADGFTISGRKLWITNGNEADLFLVFANLNPDAGYRGITAFIVERGAPGFTVGKKEDKLGIRASSTCELLFEDCVVRRDAVLGEVGKGYKVAIETLNEGRIGIGAQMLGLAQGALDHTVRYTKERKQFGKAIADFQGVQFQLARMAIDVESARLMVYNAGRLRDAGLPFLHEAAMCKIHASEGAERVASMAVNLYGGYGFVRDYPVEKLFRDAKIGQIYEGTSNMQLSTIAKQLLS